MGGIGCKRAFVTLQSLLGSAAPLPQHALLARQLTFGHASSACLGKTMQGVVKTAQTGEHQSPVVMPIREVPQAGRKRLQAFERLLEAALLEKRRSLLLRCLQIVFWRRIAHQGHDLLVATQLNGPPLIPCRRIS